MSRGWTVAIVALLFGLTALVVAYKYCYPTYSYRYRLTVNIEADGKLHSASSIVEVSWSAFFLPSYHFNPRLRGQAPLVDLGSRGVLVATLVTGDSYGPAQDGAWGALWIAARAFRLDSTNEQLPLLSTLRGQRALPLDDLPRFVWFPNPEDPKTARKVLAQDFSTVLGPSVRFVGALVEITNDPIVIDIPDRLPWLKSLEQKPIGANVIYTTDKFPITRSLFIGDGS